MRYLIFALVLLWGAPLLAKDNVIRIIKEDGTVVEFEMGRPPEAVPVAEEQAPEAEKAVMPSSPEQETATVPAAEESPVSEQPAAQDSIEEITAEPAAPSPLPDVKPKSEPEKPKQAARKDTAPVPPRKPAGAQYAAPDAYVPSRSDITPGLSVISKDVALAIALENGAPPAHSVQVLPRTYEGRDIFVVQFRTENGLYDMLVDRHSGALIERDLP